MAEQRDELEQALQEMRDMNRALVDEIRSLCESAEATYQQYKRTRRRFLVVAVLALYGIPTLGCGALSVWRLVVPRPENEAERVVREHQERLDRTDRALDRAEKLLGRWEKIAPKE